MFELDIAIVLVGSTDVTVNDIANDVDSICEDMALGSKELSVEIVVLGEMTVDIVGNREEDTVQNSGEPPGHCRVIFPLLLDAEKSNV